MSRLRCAAQDQTALLASEASLGEELSGPQAVVRLGPWLPGVKMVLFTVVIPLGNMLLPFIESEPVAYCTHGKVVVPSHGVACGVGPLVGG